MKNERDNQKSSVGDMTGLSKMPEFNEFREIVQQSSMQNETPKFKFLNTRQTVVGELPKD